MKKQFKYKKYFEILRLLIKVFLFILVFTYLVYSLLLYFENMALKIEPPSIELMDSYNNLAKVKAVRFANEEKYNNGFLKISSNYVSDIYLEESDSISKNNGEISIKNNMIFKGDGRKAIKLGNISENYNNDNGNELYIAFENNLKKEDFNSTPLNSRTVAGWIIKNETIMLGQDKAAGLATPDDADIPKGPLGVYRDAEEFLASGSLIAKIENRKDNPYDKFLLLESKNIISKEKYSLIRGPYIYKEEPIYLSKGDEIEFEWRACSAEDIYTVYAYIVDVNNNHFQKLLDQTGSIYDRSTDWQKEKIKVNKSGEYIVVFTAGSIDYSGGRAAGASLYLDNIAFNKQNNMNIVTDIDLNKIAEKIRLDNFQTANLKSFNLEIRVQNNSGDTKNMSSDYTLNNSAFVSAKNVYERKNINKFRKISNMLNHSLQRANNIYETLVNDFKNSFISLAADRDNDLENTNLAKSNTADAAIPTYGVKKANNYSSKSNVKKSNSFAEENKMNDYEKVKSINISKRKEDNKNRLKAEIFNDDNSNGRRDSSEEKIGEVLEFKLSEEKIIRDEEGNTQIVIDKNYSKELALKIQLDFKKLKELESKNGDGSISVILKLE